MSEPLSEFIIVFAFGALCFGCGYLTAFTVTRTRFHNEIIKRGAARYDSETGKWEWGEPPKSKYWMPRAASRRLPQGITWDFEGKFEST
jgi:hypothetical protein